MQVPICGCGKIMTCHQTGVRLLTHTEDGLEYQLWAGDEYRCGNCGHGVHITAENAQPISEHWKPDFPKAKSTANASGKLVLVFYGAVPRPEPLDATLAAADTLPHGQTQAAGQTGEEAEAGPSTGGAQGS